MNNKLTKSDKIAYLLLYGLGYAVDIVPTSDKEEKKESDFLVQYKIDIALVEAKLKENDPETLKERNKCLKENNVFIMDDELGRNETLSGIIRKAKNQLSSSSQKHDFKIMLFLAEGVDAKTKKDQFKDTIYGSTLIYDSKSKRSKTCYFFRNSDFYRRKIIDAAIVGYIIGDDIYFEMCLNPYSEKYNEFKNSDLLEPFKCSTHSAVIDPIELELKGLAYIPDKDINRKLDDFSKIFTNSNYNPILAHIQEKYQTGFLMNIDFKSPTITITT